MLKVKVSNITQEELFSRIQDFLKSKYQHFITTPNPEMMVAAYRDDELRHIVNYSDIAIPDGFGLVLFSKIFGARLQERITGLDLIECLAYIAEQQQYRMFLLGGWQDVAKKAAYNLKKMFPKIHVNAIEVGRVDDPKNIHKEIIQAIKNARPHILLVALGAGKQEKFIFYNLDSLPSVKLAVGVGGALDFISGNIKRAPAWMRKNGLEWLYRLWKEPKKRGGRILNAILVFPYLVIKEKVLSNSKHL